MVPEERSKMFIINIDNKEHSITCKSWYKFKTSCIMNQWWSSFSRRHLEMHDIASRIIIALSGVIRD